MAPGRLRNPRRDRARRHGRNLSRAPATPQQDRRRKARSGLSRWFTSNAQALSTRSRRGSQPRSSEHSSDLRGERERGWPSVLQHEIRDGRQLAKGCAFSARRTPAMCATDGQGCTSGRIRAWPGNSPSRSQAGKHSTRRPRRTAGERFRSRKISRCKQGPYKIADYFRNSRLHCAGTGRGRSHRSYPSRRCLQPRRDSLRAARWPRTVFRLQRGCRHAASGGNARTEAALACTLTQPGFGNCLCTLSRARSKSALPICGRSRE